MENTTAPSARGSPKFPRQIRPRSVTAPEGTTAIVWSVDGVTQSTPEAIKTGATKWSFSWTVSGLSDGTYQVGAQAQQANGVIGPAVSIPVKLIRSVPAAPSE